MMMTIIQSPNEYYSYYLGLIIQRITTATSIYNYYTVVRGRKYILGSANRDITQHKQKKVC